MSSMGALDHRFFWNTKTFKIPTNLDSNETGASMGIKNNDQEPGGINKNANETDRQ